MGNAKRKYDAKRRHCEERKLKERNRGLARKLTRDGWCRDCGEVCKTVIHHATYEGNDSVTREVCYPCHREIHPRRMPNGVVV